MTRRELIERAIALVLAHPKLSALSRSDKAQIDAALADVHPELRSAAIAALAEMGTMPRFSGATLKQIRSLYEQGAAPPEADIRWERIEIPGGGAQPGVTALLINAAPERSRAAILHLHGGGFVTGSARVFLPMLQVIASELDCAILSVDYRLAPEARHAESVDDNYLALKWLFENAHAVGADPSRLAVMGESAGGGHAALVAIRARDRGEVPLAFQCLTYPMLDDRTGSSHAARHGTGGLVWTAADNRFGWEAFLGVAPGTTSVPSQAVPSRVADLSGLPPCFIAVGSIDLFAEEDVEYARRLAKAKVSTELLLLPGAFHGFDFYPEAQGSRIVKRFQDARLAALRAGLNGPRPGA